MPYIKKDRRAALVNDMTGPQVAGELNYALTLLLVDPKMNPTRFVVAAAGLLQGYREKHDLNYQTINDIIGAVLGALFEYMRRKNAPSQYEGALLQVLRDFYKDVAGPYEDIKITENGDVYV